MIDNLQAQTPTQTGVDYKQKTFTTISGKTFHVQGVSPMIIERMQSDETGKPQVPIVEVELLDGVKHSEENPNDPDYVAAVNAWKRSKEIRMIKYIFTSCIVDEPTRAEAEYWLELMPTSNRFEVKYLWVSSFFTGGDKEIMQFVEVLLAQTMITAGGVDTASARFPGDD